MLPTFFLSYLQLQKQLLPYNPVCIRESWVIEEKHMFKPLSSFIFSERKGLLSIISSYLYLAFVYDEV